MININFMDCAYYTLYQCSVPITRNYADEERFKQNCVRSFANYKNGIIKIPMPLKFWHLGNSISFNIAKNSVYISARQTILVDNYISHDCPIGMISEYTLSNANKELMKIYNIYNFGIDE